MTTNDFVAGDDASKLKITCKDSQTQLAIDLTGSSVFLRWVDTAGVLQEVEMDRIVPFSDGKAEYLFAAGELIVGVMDYDIRIVDALGRVMTNVNIVDARVREPKTP